MFIKKIISLESVFLPAKCLTPFSLNFILFQVHYNNRHCLVSLAYIILYLLCGVFHLFEVLCKICRFKDKDGDLIKLKDLQNLMHILMFELEREMEMGFPHT